MALSQQPSTQLSNPSASRKLLVLDLNGTLLVRSSHSRHHSRLRAVHPRPYIPAFRAYLFAPETQGWLDTMVWSSAQPHSVADMVDKVFGSYKCDLKAVWNRESLGLTTEEYHRKTLTTKDLTKPWKLLPLGVSPAEHSEQSSNSERRSSALPDGSSSLAHSALTTLLLDDSLHKAMLQPYNHVCIPEYDSGRRSHDLLSLQAFRKSSKRIRSQESKVKDVVESGADSLAEFAHSASDSDLSVSDLSINESSDSAGSDSKEPFDVVLLAVVGILDAVKRQSNVAGWVRGGGLLAAGKMATDAERTVEQSFAEDAYGKKRARQEARGSSVGEKRIVDGQTMLADETVVTRAASTTSELSALATQEDAKLQATTWFDDGPTLAYWVGRGREALFELGIEAAHGVTG
ncbi:hypothetical protein F5I97DRAFT_1936412 [Phlebopus sp. FC_14]|nr:hypothetical protein F5I97DRAFT_1936412 [Phlebopus sp. FC_14]